MSMENILFPINFPVDSNSIEETFSLGENIAKTLKRGDIVALYGEVGAGKTHLVKGICHFFGIHPDDVNSPTFTLVNEYDGVMQGESVAVFHFDAYRIEAIEEFYAIGYEDYFYADGICLIEWADRIEALLPPETLRIEGQHLAENRRRYVRI